MAALTMEFTDADDLDKMREPNLIEEGDYHLFIASYESLISERDQIQYGFRLTFQVLAGSIAGQEKKTFEQAFNFPSKAHKDGGAFCGRALKALCIASGLVRPGTTGSINVDFEQLLDLQLIGRIKHRKWESKEKGTSGTQAELAGLLMWHVDEPAAAHVPRHQLAMQNYPGHRWNAEQIAAAQAKLQEKGQQAQTAAAPAVSSAATPAAEKPAPKTSQNNWANI